MLDFFPLSQEKLNKIERDITKFIRNEVEIQKKNGIMIGLSGGIDSAVCAALAVNALGKDKVKALILPDIDSDPETPKDAFLVAEYLGIQKPTLKDITSILEEVGVYSLLEDLYPMPRVERERIVIEIKRKLSSEFKKVSKNLLLVHRENSDPYLRKVKALWNSKIRVRMVSLYLYAEQNNLLVLGTTNKTEYLLGYFTKHGDSAVDIEPLISLYKTNIFELARFLKIPEKIVVKKPSGDILPGFDDQSIIDLTYEQIDRILLGLEKGVCINELSKILEIDISLINYISNLMKTSYYSRIPPIHFIVDEQIMVFSNDYENQTRNNYGDFFISNKKSGEIT